MRPSHKMYILTGLFLAGLCNLAVADGGYDDSDSFPIDIGTQATSHYADSGLFSLDSNPRSSGKYSDSSSISINSFRVNKAWSDSEVLCIATTSMPSTVNYVKAIELHENNIKGYGTKIGLLEEALPWQDHASITGRIINGETEPDPMDDDQQHAIKVASIIIGKDNDANINGASYSGLAPTAILQANMISGWFSAFDIDNAMGELIAGGCDIINYSGGLAADNPDNLIPIKDIEQTINSFVDEDKISIIVSIGNTGQGHSVIASPAQAYNVIAVGATGNDQAPLGEEGNMYNILSRESIAGPTSDVTGVGGRCKPDIVAPGRCYAANLQGVPPDGLLEHGYSLSGPGTSFACPHISGAVSLLVQAARDYKSAGNNLTFVDNSSVDPRAVKAALLTGADKNVKAIIYDSNGQAVGTRNWQTSGPSQPLDHALGAGGLNVLESYKILLSQDDIIFGKSIKRKTYFDHIAWIERDISPVTAEIGYLPVGSEFTATLVWNAHPDLINNLDMTVYCDGDVVAESVSVVDNVEHVWFETPRKGNYSIAVRFITHTSGLTELEYFAFSYRIASSRITGDFNDDGKIDMTDLGYLAQRWLNNTQPFTEADLTGDGMINFADFCTLSGSWLTGVE